MSRFNFIIILLIGFVDHMGIGLVYPIFAALFFDPQQTILPLDASLAYRGAMLGILLGLTPLTQFFSAPLLGVFSDNHGRRQALILGIGVGCVGYGLAIVGIWTNTLWLLFVYRILVGISDGTAAVAQATIADLSTDENKARRFSLLNSSLGFGFTIGPFLGGKLANPDVASWFGYATPFMAAGLMCLMNFLMVSWKFPETRQFSKKSSFNLKDDLFSVHKVFLWKNLRWLFLAGFVFTYGWSFFSEFIPVLLNQRFGFTPNDVGNYYAFCGACYAFSAGIAAAPLLKRFPPEKLVICAMFGSALCMLAILVFSSAGHIWWIVAILMYFLAIVYPTATAIVSDRADPNCQGEVLGTYQSVQACAMGLSPLMVGSAIGMHPELAAWGGAVAMVLGGCAFWRASRLLTGKQKWEQVASSE